MQLLQIIFRISLFSSQLFKCTIVFHYDQKAERRFKDMSRKLHEQS